MYTPIPHKKSLLRLVKIAISVNQTATDKINAIIQRKFKPLN